MSHSRDRADDLAECGDGLGERFPPVQVDLKVLAQVAPSIAEVVAEAVAQNEGSAARPAWGCEFDCRCCCLALPARHHAVPRSYWPGVDFLGEGDASVCQLEMHERWWAVARRIWARHTPFDAEEVIAPGVGRSPPRFVEKADVVRRSDRNLGGADRAGSERPASQVNQAGGVADGTGCE